MGRKESNQTKQRCRELTSSDVDLVVFNVDNSQHVQM